MSEATPRRLSLGPVALVCAVDLEAEPLRRRMSGVRRIDIGRRPAYRGFLGDTEAVLVTGGMGKVNAAQALTALLESGEVGLTICFGVGGAYPGSGLNIGDLALANSEIYTDEGVLTLDGWQPTDTIGIPLLETATDRYQNEFTLDAALVQRTMHVLNDAGFAVQAGPFGTVSTCSGTERQGEALRRRFGVICESMEGAACAHVAALYQVPFLELRGISNLVENRNLGRWRLPAAAEAAAGAAALIAAEHHRINPGADS